MARKQTGRVVINVTDAQWIAADKALRKAIGRNRRRTKNSILIDMLKGLCAAYEVEWPEFEPEWGGNRHPEKLSETDA